MKSEHAAHVEMARHVEHGGWRVGKHFATPVPKRKKRSALRRILAAVFKKGN